MGNQRLAPYPFCLRAEFLVIYTCALLHCTGQVLQHCLDCRPPQGQACTHEEDKPPRSAFYIMFSKNERSVIQGFWMTAKITSAKFRLLLFYQQDYTKKIRKKRLKTGKPRTMVFKLKCASELPGRLAETDCWATCLEFPV